MKTTIKDIARVMSVNVATVSRAMNNKPGVSADLRRQILKKAAELHYMPSGQARGLVTQRTETVGLVFDIETSAFLSNPFYGGVLAGIESELRRHSYSLMFSSTEGASLNSLADLPKFIMERRVDGIIVIGAVEAETLQLLREIQLPLLMVDYHLEDIPVDAVIVDNRRGGRMTAEYLLELGHRKLGFVGGGPLDEGNFGERLQGFKDALANADITLMEDHIHGGRIEGGYDSTRKLLECHPETTGIVACNDANAFAAIRAVRAMGREVPADISVVGFDDIAAAPENWPPLTTVRIDKKALGRTAAQRLLQKLKSEEPAPPHETVFPAELIVRESTAPPKS
jgi:LacI family transcriptional regulator